MHIPLFVSIASLVLYIIPCQSIPNSDLMNKIIPALDILCPFANVCRELRPDFIPEETEGDNIPCCEECSCADDCHIKRNCCFPKEQNIYSCIQTVIPPSSKIGEIIPSYKIITQPPSTGCINDISSKFPTNQALWGDLFPVSSPSTKQIFKNQSIAECHNVFDGLLWKINMSCSDPIDINDFSNVLNTLNQSSEYQSTCKLQFSYPGDSKDIASERCFPEVISTCRISSFPIPDNLNLTQSDYIALCESDFKSAWPDMLIFKNSFCVVCNGYFKKNKAGCEVVGGRSPMPAFSFILNSKFLKPSKVITPTKDIDLYDEVACRKDDMGSDECRIIHCPSFHLRDENGICIPFADSVGITLFQIKLRLIPEKLLSTRFCDVNEEPSSFIVNITSESPWDLPWIVAGLYCNKHDSLTIDNTLYILLEAKTDANVNEWLSQVSKTLQKRWQILFDGSYIQMRQQNRGFYFGQFIYVVEKSGRVITEPLHVLHYNGIQAIGYPRMPLTPLFFCKQIELKPHEYTIGEHDILTYNMANNTLFRHEYIQINANTLRICLEDSGFIKRTSKANSLLHEKITIFILLNMTLACVLMKFA